MLLGVIADDFTGASDIANTISKGVAPAGGLRTAQFLGVPKGAAAVDIEAGVVALKSRTVPVEEAVSDSLRALKWLLAQGCQQIVFKYCSTFDSTRIGNIGPVGEALAVALGAKGVVVCPAFPGAGRTIYMGHLFVQDRLLNESGMQNHPLTPMTDPDIRRWLALQTKATVGHIGLATVRKGMTAVSHALATTDDTFVIVDATSDEDLITIGSAITDHKLVTGGSGIAIGLPNNFISRGLASGNFGGQVGVAGPEAILAGSCSGATRGQIDLHKENHPTLAIDVDKVMSGATKSDDIVEFIKLNNGKAPLAYSSGTPDEVCQMQAKYGREEVAAKLDDFFADVARKLVQSGVKRLVVAGGETSGAVVSALDLGALTIGQEIDPGVPVLVSHGDQPIALALKSGNFGSPDFFTKAIERLNAK
ncbi:3-oxo-tetronate kinase [Rhizobium mesosinicum]|uniref:3-oxo-tetronate kinase n=1 Tax=Rhizobium mesosinicum TaxID=335017 RepID=A0ABS7GQZ8_9HYPH|nr:3-oxo-tetronate kinase [Rhizobium mesosinicum]MBW9052370.1 four-carbon acid sugar kinase family protein [Rhizobium mesosinicum]